MDASVVTAVSLVRRAGLEPATRCSEGIREPTDVHACPNADRWGSGCLPVSGLLQPRNSTGIALPPSAARRFSTALIHSWGSNLR